MIINFRGICSGTETRISRRTGQPYQVTTFVELPSMKLLEVFGDLGLPVTETPVQWSLDATVKQIENVKILSGAVAQKKPTETK